MSGRLRRVLAIVKVDVLTRFRRLSTLVVFLLLNLLAYLSVPDPAGGNALLVVEDGRRALYNSAAIGMATAVLSTLFIGLAGFYVVSSALRQDISTRCGFVIASTTMRAGEYLFAKFLGNVVFLATFTAGFMLTSMGMLLVRNEAGLEVGRFVWHYLLLVPPAIVLTAVLALLFESIPFLSGRTGDVLYFFLYLGLSSFVTLLVATHVDPGPARYFDFAGLGFVVEQMTPGMKVPNLSIGGSFDPAKPLFVFRGLTLDRGRILPRLGSLLIPLPLLWIALLTFHRFDPARVRSGAGTGRRAWMARLNAALKPMARLLPALGGAIPSARSLPGAATTDARMTFSAVPAMLLLPVGIAVATAFSSKSAFLRGVLPVAFGVAGVAIADISCRDRRAGTLALIHSMPRLRRRFVWWKLLAAGFVAAALMAAPLARVALAHPEILFPFGIGLFTLVAVATSMGVVSGTPKTFTLLFLVFWYVMTNDNGASPALDFAGFYQKSAPLVAISYAAIAAAFLAAAQGVHAARLRRDGS